MGRRTRPRKCRHRISDVRLVLEPRNVPKGFTRLPERCRMTASPTVESRTIVSPRHPMRACPTAQMCVRGGQPAEADPSRLDGSGSVRVPGRCENAEVMKTIERSVRRERRFQRAERHTARSGRKEHRRHSALGVTAPAAQLRPALGTGRAADQHKTRIIGPSPIAMPPERWTIRRLFRFTTEPRRIGTRTHRLAGMGRCRANRRTG
jgi:hypothetical protein